MHARLVIIGDICNLSEDKFNSEDARAHADCYLEGNGFAGEGGMFSSPPADWYVIGGRWSGWLTNINLDQDKFKRFNDEFEARHIGTTSLSQTEEANRKNEMVLLKEIFTTRELPMKYRPLYTRDAYRHEGYDDDAMVLNKKQWNYIQNELEEDTSGDIFSGNCYHIINGNRFPPVGHAYGVVVDFHS